ncbi:MAG: preprotein translocase subunit SecG [Planctomycetota bacterium]
MDEDIGRYLKVYGTFAVVVALIILLAVGGFVVILRVLLGLLCVALVGLILLQQSKGGGLVSALGGMEGDSAFGTSATPIKKLTAFLAVLFLILVLALTKAQQQTTRIEPQPAAAPESPAPEPAPPKDSAAPSPPKAADGVAPAAPQPAAPSQGEPKKEPKKEAE